MENAKDLSSTQGLNEMPQITAESASFLLKTAKWGKFLAILGFIVTGLLVLTGILMSFVIGMLPQEMVPLNMPFPSSVFSIIYIIIAGIYIIPIIFLNSFCNNAMKAINLGSTEHMTNSIRNLKNLFVFIGISTIVILAFYTIVLVLVGAAAMFSL